jgi:5-formyltetrahydrofolate cyclo-ligase
MQDKTYLRKEILSRRDRIPQAAKKIKDSKIQERLSGLQEFRASKTIFFFASFRSEADTFGLIRKSLEEGRRVVLPKVEGNDLGLYEIRGLDELVPGYMGIPEPCMLGDDRKVGVNDPARFSTRPATG